MKQRIVIAGCGFAGFWAAVAAVRAVTLAEWSNDIEVMLVSPTPRMVIRPRLYEARLENMDPDVSAQLAAAGVRYLAGRVEQIDTAKRTLQVRRRGQEDLVLNWDRLVLATGSQLFMAQAPGFAEFGFDVDTLESARRLEAHLRALKERAATAARNTAVVVGGGLTGLECAAEMPQRLRSALGLDAQVRVVIVDAAAEVGADMGAEPAKVIREALTACGVEQRAGVSVVAVDADGVTLADGERIASGTVILAAGLRASPLAAQIPGKHDALGRVIADDFLQAPAAPGVLVTGDSVRAAADDRGHHNLMSCQHAMSLGRVAGYNAAADLLGMPLYRYRQPKYVTCLALGPWGGLYTEGWERQVRLTGDEGGALKQEITTEWIYPPAANRDALFAIAGPDHVIVP